MTLTTKIKRKLYQYFTKQLGVKKYRRGWLRAPHCPSCDKKEKWSVNLATNRSNCFSCGYNDKPLDVVSYVEGFTTTKEVLEYLRDFKEGNYYEEEVKPYELKKDLILPDGYRGILRGDSLIARTVRKYVEGRGFDLKEVSRAGWGYGTKDKYAGYLIMPFYSDGQLIYFNARRVIGNGPKFNNPNVEEFGLGKSMLLYNVDALGIYDTIYVVESVTNARTLGDNAIGCGGKKISNFQLNLMLKSQASRFIIGLDRDGLDDSIDNALKLVQHKKVKILQFKDDRDINDLGRRKTLIKTYKSKWLTYQDIIRMKNELL